MSRQSSQAEEMGSAIVGFVHKTTADPVVSEKDIRGYLRRSLYSSASITQSGQDSSVRDGLAASRTRRPSRTATAALVGSLLAVTSVVSAQPQQVRSNPVPVGSAERKAILDAIRPQIADNAGQSVEFRVISIRSNGRWAYVYARAQRPGGAALTKAKQSQFAVGWVSDPYFEALAKRTPEGWVWSGHMLGRALNNGSVADMCNFGDGIGSDTFIECR